MKKLQLAFIATTLCFMSCKNETKDKQEIEGNPEQSLTEAVYVAKPEAAKLTFTAYKTTEKLPVNGTFTTLNFQQQTGNSIAEALNGISFGIPVASLFTNDITDVRDPKIKEFFFGAMERTENITGKLSVVNNTANADIMMNGISVLLPLEMKIEDERRVTLTGTVHLEKWNALTALASLNKVCFDLHKGPDGISKTWEEVTVEFSIFLRDK